MKKMAVCIPTYNRSDVIEELLTRVAKRYSAIGWDILIYDSSTDDYTQSLYESKWKDAEGVFYHRVNSSIHSNRKVYGIFQEQAKAREYEYIWVCSDSISWNDKCLCDIQDALNKNYDFIAVNYRDVEKVGTCTITDKNEAFIKCAWHMTLYGATILNVSTVLGDVDWEYLIDRYCVSDRINFSHVALYFEQMKKMNSFQLLHLSVPSNYLMPSPLKKESGWKQTTFFIMCTCWPSMISALPKEYDNDKESVILQNGINSGILLMDSLVELRNRRMYTLDIFIKYFSSWKKLTSVKRNKLFLLAVIPPRISFLFDYRNVRISRSYEKKLIRFNKMYPQMYIYGCGAKSARLSDWITDIGLNVQAYVVTNSDNEKKEFRGKPVIQMDENIFSNKEIGLVMGVCKSNEEEIVDKIDSKFEKRILRGFYNVKGIYHK